MLPAPSFVSIPTFGSVATKVPPDPGPYSSGYLPGQTFPAEHENYFMGGLTQNGNTEQAQITVINAELNNWLTAYGYTPTSGLNNQILTMVSGLVTPIQIAVTESGLTWDPTDAYILSKAQIAMSHQVGEDLYMNNILTQVYFGAARSSANPGYPQYCPVVERNVDKLVTSSQAPLLVAALRAQALTLLGTSSFTATVSGSNLTFGSSTINNQLLALLYAEGLVRRWMVSQDANYAASGPLYSGGPAPMTINVAGADYDITSINTGTRIVAVSGTPTSGSQTIILYPYRTSASASNIQLPRLSGFVPVGSDDVDGLITIGYRSMDTFQGHRMSPLFGSTFLNGNGSATTASTGGSAGVAFANSTTGDPVTDTVNGAARTGKNTSPRTLPRRIYTWAGVLLASA